MSDIEYLTPNQVKIDTQVNRFYDDNRARSMSRSFNIERAVKSGLVVSRRADGTYVALDGQHRFGGARHAGLGDVPMAVMVITDLTREEEAEWVLEFQEDRRATSPAESHRLGVKAGRPLDVRVSQICEKHGLKMAGYKGPYTIAAVETVKGVAKRPNGPDTLDRTLALVTRAWPGEPASFESPVLRGISEVISRHSGSVDLEALAKKLSKETPSKMIARASSRSEDLNIPKWKAFSNVVIGVYNTHRPKESRLSEV